MKVRSETVKHVPAVPATVPPLSAPLASWKTDINTGKGKIRPYRRGLLLHGLAFYHDVHILERAVPEGLRCCKDSTRR